MVESLHEEVIAMELQSYKQANCLFIGLALVGKDIVFRFIIECIED